MRKAFLLPMFLGAAAFAQSPRAIIGWGDEYSPSDAASRGMGEAGAGLRSDKSWDPRLEARSAYATLAAFEVQIQTQAVVVDNNTTTNTLSGSGIPKVSLSLPLGRFGHLGLGYWQRFQKKFDWSSPTDSTVKLLSEGGAFEGDIAYSLVVPGLRNLALGATYHRVMGTDRLYQQETRQFPDEYLSVLSRDTLSHNYWGDYWTASAYWTQGDFDGGLWMDMPGSVEVKTTRGANDQIFAVLDPKNVTSPASIGAAGAWRFTGKQLAVAQVSRTAWDDAIPGSDPRWDAGLGWQYSPGGDRFDEYWRQMCYRAGLSTSMGGPQSLMSESATLGAGMPLGLYGTLDLSLQIGQNKVDAGAPKLKDSFVRFYVAITGASLWGRSQRAHR